MSSSNFVSKEISPSVAGTFPLGWLSSMYAPQKFAATLNVGSNYIKTSTSWDSAAFILGFNIRGRFLNYYMLLFVFILSIHTHNTSDTHHHAVQPLCYAEIRGRPLNQYTTDL